MVRMYKNELPQPGDIVMCKIIEVHEIGSYVQLLEYDNIVGMIGVTEYSKQRIRSISKLVNVGKHVVAEVINVDERTKNIDLSKKTVCGKEINDCEEKFERSKKVHSIVRRYSELSDAEQVEKIMVQTYEKYLWHLEEPYEYCKSIGRGIESIDDELFFECCSKAFQVKPVNIVGYASLICFGREGIDAIRTVLINIKQKYKDIKVTYYGKESSYVFSAESTEPKMAADVINQAMNEAVNNIKTFEGGDGSIKESAKFMDDTTNRTYEQALKIREMNSSKSADVSEEDDM